MSPNKWKWPLALVLVFIVTLSLRQLSDPDLGFHLKYGKWIVTHQQIPVTDQSTYTVANHPYIDLHWLFQVALYGVFRFAGYEGISIFICFLSTLLAGLLLWRQRSSGIPLPITCAALFLAYLIIDPRITPRPEMFTFLFLTGVLFILDLYSDKRRNLLFLIPGIMLLWCNMHSLFILGLVVLGVYFMSILIRDKKPNKPLMIILVISILACFINPYGIKGFIFPLELLTRFDPDNIYKQHIQEIVPFFAQARFIFRDYLFMALLGSILVLTFLTFDRQKLHDYFLVVLFGFLAVSSIRNIPIFILIALPVVTSQAYTVSRKTLWWQKKTGIFLFMLMIILPVGMILRLRTNAFYINNKAINKTGTGIDTTHLPMRASTFLLDHHLDARILNSIGFGGWLSWVLPQPVFIDGRLEVMQEAIYKKVTQSWNGGLPGLIDEYQPRIIIYNYQKYYPWSLQLKEMNDWRLIYADGVAAIFAQNSYATEIPALEQTTLISPATANTGATVTNWLQGFTRQTDYAAIDMKHQEVLRQQLISINAVKNNLPKATEYYNSANLKHAKGDIAGALADYDSAILLHPGYSKAYNNRGILRASALKDLPGARSDFDKAIRFNPGNGDAYLGRGTVNFLLKDLQAACKDWESARLLGNVQAARLIGLHCNH